MLNEFLIVTFPRCGSHYLQHLFLHKTGIKIRKTHNKDIECNNKITIVRNPLDNLISAMVMANRDPISYTPKQFDIVVFQYIEFYKKIIDNFEHIIDYDTLSSSPDKVVKYLASKMNIEVPNGPYTHDLSYVKENYPQYILTAKEKPLLYSMAKEYYSMQDLSEANHWYEMCKQIKDV